MSTYGCKRGLFNNRSVIAVRLTYRELVIMRRGLDVLTAAALADKGDEDDPRVTEKLQREIEWLKTKMDAKIRGERVPEKRTH